MAGHTPDMSQLVVGEGILNPGKGTIKYDIQLPGTELKCSGLFETYYKTRAFGGIGSKLRGGFKCNDGRTGSAHATVVEIGENKGTAKDECGNVFHFYAAIDEVTIDELREEYEEKIKASGREFVDKCDAKGGMPEHFDPLI